MEQANENLMKRVVLDQETLVPVGVLSILVCSIAGGAIWLNDKMSRIEYRLLAIENQVDDRWTATDMRHWVELVGSRNPSLALPPPEHK